MQKIHWLSQNAPETQSQRQGCLPTCSSSLRKVVSALEKEVQNLKYQNKELEDKLQSQKKVTYHQQNQLMSIIRKMNEGIGRKMTIPNIAEMQEKVMESLELFSNMNLDAVDQQYNQTIQVLNRKVFEIEGTFKNELCKVKANVVTDPLQVKNELVNLYHSALLIENRNMDLIKQNKKLRLDMDIIKQEKLLMVEDLSKMRSGIHFLVEQGKKNEKSTSREKSQNSKETIKRSSLPHRSIQHYTIDSFPKQNNNNKIISFNISKEQKIAKNESQKELTKNYSELSANHQNSMIIPNIQKTDLNNRLKKNDVSFHSAVSCTHTPRSLNKRSSYQWVPNAILFSKQLNQVKLENKSIKIKDSSSNYTIDTRAQQKDFIVCPDCKHKIIESENRQEVIFKNRQKLYINTIEKLEGCLKREKSKALCMGNTFRQVCEENKQIGRLVSQIVAENYHKPGGKIEQLILGQNLVSVLRELKSRIDEKSSIVDRYESVIQN